MTILGNILKRYRAGGAEAYTNRPFSAAKR